MIKFYFEPRNSAIGIGKLFSASSDKQCEKRSRKNKHGFDFICTRSHNHFSGLHVAHGVTNNACAVWMGSQNE